MKTKLFFALLVLSLIANAQYTKLLDFAGVTNGSSPFRGNLISDGVYLYGMTQLGGTNDSGTIFKIKPDGSGDSVLLNFSGPDGRSPRGSVIYDGTFLYGMTVLGGLNNMGTIFKIKLNGTGYVKLLDFSGPDGSHPYGALIYDGTFLYGMTELGGANNKGTVFKIKPNGSGDTVLLNFAGVANGSSPFGSLVYDGTYLYGMTLVGGLNNKGVIFKIKPDGTGYVDLLDFAGTTNGSLPNGSLFYDGVFLYGMTLSGGVNNKGIIFRIKTDGSRDSVLLNFAGANGRNPRGTLISDGVFLYGTTIFGGTNDSGTVFKIMPDGAGYTDLVDFTGISNGSCPWGALCSDGTCLYGMTQAGGANYMGTVYKYCLNSSAGVTENNARHGFIVYPNPANDQFIIETNTTDKLTVDLYDLNGRQLFSKRINEKIIINAATLEEGIYYLISKTVDGVIRKKLVVVH